MDTNEILAQHGLVIVEAKDVRYMMDYFFMAAPYSKTAQTKESYERLWRVLHEAGLDLG